jgi:acetyltransferase-like isoleucine patch superfamily enzyme
MTIAKTAIIKDCKLGEGTRVGDYSILKGCQTGKNCNIESFVEINDIKVGNRVKICSHTFLCYLLTIEDDVFIGHGVMTINDIHPPSYKRTKSTKAWKKTTIKKGAVIGSNATLLPVKIGKNAIVAAGSVVTKDVPANTMVAGNPARIIKKVTTKE